MDEGGHERTMENALDSPETIAAVMVVKMEMNDCEGGSPENEADEQSPLFSSSYHNDWEIREFEPFWFVCPIVAANSGRKPEDGMIGDLSKVGEGSRRMHRRLHQRGSGGAKGDINA